MRFFAITLTGIGWAALPFLIVAIASLAIAVVVVRRRAVRVGFDPDEAASFVWTHLSREQRGRIALAHVAAMLQAERDADESITDENELRELLAHAANDAGAQVDSDDVDDLLQFQYDYAAEKGLF